MSIYYWESKYYTSKYAYYLLQTIKNIYMEGLSKFHMESIYVKNSAAAEHTITKASSNIYSLIDSVHAFSGGYIRKGVTRTVRYQKMRVRFCILVEIIGIEWV